VNPDAVTIARAGAWPTLTGEALLSMSITEVSAAHARIIARNVDKATVTKIEDATPDAIGPEQSEWKPLQRKQKERLTGLGLLGAALATAVKMTAKTIAPFFESAGVDSTAPLRLRTDRPRPSNLDLLAVSI
jgi:hypothetical protein